MMNPWQLYDTLIAGIASEITVRGIATRGKWTRVATSDGCLGVALGMESGPGMPGAPASEDVVGMPLKDLAEKAKSWGFAEAAVGVAAINAYYSHPGRATANGFVAVTEDQSFPELFASYSERVAGKKVVVIGHFPFAPRLLAKAAEFRMLERYCQEGDLPDSACEYVLGDADYVFISGSAFVNKTAPRLLQLSRGAHSVILGPSTPLHPVLRDYGATVVSGLVTRDAEGMCGTLGEPGFPKMFEYGSRVVLGE